MSKKEKTNKQEATKSIIVKLRNTLRGTPKPRAVLSEARQNIPVSAFGELLAWIRANPRIAVRVFHPPYPRELAQLKAFPMMSQVSPEREFRWAVTYLAPHAERLKEFVIWAAKFQRAFLVDDFNVCLNVLDEVEGRFGQSLWLIKRRIAFLQNSAGLEAQKQYATLIREATGRGSIPAFVAHYVSMYNEPSVTFARFQSQFEARLQKLELSADFSLYLRQHITPVIGLAPNEMAEVLRRENAGAVVDYYETFTLLAQIAATSGVSELESTLKKVLPSFYARTLDPRLAAVITELERSSHIIPAAQTASVQAAEALYQGDFLGASRLAETALSADPTDMDAVMVVSRVNVMLGKRMEGADKPLLRRIESRLSGVVAKDATASDDAAEITKIAAGFLGEPWANALVGIMEREATDAPSPRARGYAHFATVSAPVVHPLRVFSFPVGDGRSRYANFVRSVFPSSIMSEVVSGLVDGGLSSKWTEGILWEERVLTEATCLLEQRKWQDALEQANSLGKSAYDYYRLRALRISCHLLLRLGRAEECVERLTTAYVNVRSCHDILPIADAAALIAREENQGLSSNISVPILFEAYGRYVDRTYEAEGLFSYSEFLYAHRLNSPSEIGKIKERFDRQKLVYFLRYVCVESIMARSGMFGSSRALLEERLSICRLLIEIDESGLEVYQSETKALLRRLMLQKRMKEVEQSKIYVDTDSIKRTVAEELAETFNRYMALRRERIEPGDAAVIQAALKKINESGDPQELVMLTIPRHETNELLESIVGRLLNEYVASPEHGLDKYLSVRIRHGTLAAHLRKPVDAAKLIMPRESGSSLYKRNSYWPNRIPVVAAEVREVIADRLAGFSRDFDQLIEDIKAWIQIRKGSNREGMFDFELNEAGLRLFSVYVQSEPTFEEFVDYVIEAFGDALDQRLEIVRGRIDNVAKKRGSDLLDALEADFERFELGDVADTREIINAIRTAKTDLRVAFDRVRDWFRRARTTAKEPFPLENAIDISVETVRTVAPSFTAEVVAPSEPSLMLPGGVLTVFVDIFFIIFENIVRHSGVSSNPVAKVFVDFDEGRLRILVENDLGPGTASEAAKLKIARIRSDMSQGLHVASVSREGGTGLHKIGKLLAHDIGFQSDLDFGFLEDARFFVRFSAPMSPLLGIAG